MSRTIISTSQNVFKATPNNSNTCISSDITTFRAPSSSSVCVTETATVSDVRFERQQVTPTNNQIHFLLSYAPKNAEKSLIFAVNGIIQCYGADYSVSGSVLTFVPDNYSLDSDDRIIIQYVY